MLSSREAFENDFCPVGDDLLGELYRSNQSGLPDLVESVSSDVRAMLALFCYRRAHLQPLALLIAGTCTERDLYQIGGRAGTVLYALANKSDPKSIGVDAGGRRSVTLSTKPLTHVTPDYDETDDLDDEPDSELRTIA